MSIEQVNTPFVLTLRIKKSLQDLSLQKLDIQMMARTFPQKDDYDGAIRAMFTLHYSYTLNLTMAVTNGTLLILDTNNNVFTDKVKDHFKTLFQKYF